MTLTDYLILAAAVVTAIAGAVPWRYWRGFKDDQDNSHDRRHP
jgi:hypothetical protein